MTIVYNSKTGFTQQYAQMLAKAQGLSALSLEEACAQLASGSPVLFMGWVMAGHISGVDQAVRRWKVQCAVGVGMSPAGKEVLATLSKANYIPNAPIFYLQGGWAPKKVSWFQRRMVGMVTRSIRRQLQAKAKRTEQEQQMLDLLVKGGSRVEFRSLKPIQDWLSQHG